MKGFETIPIHLENEKAGQKRQAGRNFGTCFHTGMYTKSTYSCSKIDFEL